MVIGQLVLVVKPLQHLHAKLLGRMNAQIQARVVGRRVGQVAHVVASFVRAVRVIGRTDTLVSVAIARRVVVRRVKAVDIVFVVILLTYYLVGEARAHLLVLSVLDIHPWLLVTTLFSQGHQRVDRCVSVRVILRHVVGLSRDSLQRLRMGMGLVNTGLLVLFVVLRAGRQTVLPVQTVLVQRQRGRKLVGHVVEVVVGQQLDIRVACVIALVVYSHEVNVLRMVQVV